MGMLLSTQANFELARLHYEKAISLEPLFIDAHANLLEALELQGKLDELSNKIRKIEKIFSEVPSELRLYNALLFMRQNEISEALKVLDKIDEDALSAPRKLSFYEMKGKALDKASEFEAAFVTFDRLSKLKKESNMYDKKTANSYLYEYQKLYSEIKLLSENYHRKKGTPENKVVFLIGFPRSGTTLLDTILRSHSKVTVIEEEPLIWKAKTDLAQNGQYNYLTSHPSDSKIAIALENYLKSAKVLSSASEDQIIIDKLPLNILELPFINTLFPNAKVILAVRHPLDCILSNWMQNFRLNPAMSNLITLEEIVEFYDLSMSLCEQANYKLGINPYIIRYEDLVDNFHPEVLNLLNYLCLTWEDGVTNYHKTAHERKYIKTPSRSQVIQPLYGTSKYKWKNYEGYLRDYFPKLNKWIEKFNYNALP
jgi:tetratricopeptide (TPR) repeat protein